MTTGSSLRIGEAILGGVVLGLGLFIAIETSQLEVAPTHAAIGPTLFPFLIAAGLLIVGALVLLRGLLRPHRARARASSSTGAPWRSSRPASSPRCSCSRAWAGSSPRPCCSWRRPWPSAAGGCVLDAAIGVVLTGLAFVVFNYGLGLTLPIGTAIEQLLPADDEEAE